MGWGAAGLRLSMPIPFCVIPRHSAGKKPLPFLKSQILLPSLCSLCSLWLKSWAPTEGGAEVGFLEICATGPTSWAARR